MAEEKIAEEILCLFSSVDYTISDTKDGVFFDGKIAPHCANVFTRQEAIEKMAKARYAQRPCYDKHGNEISFEEAKEDYQLFYKDLIKEVEPLLNALLGDK